LLRGVLFYSTGGLCAGCGEHLTEGWHADHVIPFSIEPTTNVHRMQPLCPKCNLTKGIKILPQMPHMLRPWQQEFVRLCDIISETNRKIIVRAVPASGKGSVPYLLLGHAPRSEVLYACHVVPRINLKTQSETPPRWLLDYFESSGLRAPSIRASTNITPFRRGSDGYSICWDSIRGGANL
jgi:HNH endonuclease